jgi:hypothetical protein
MNRVLSFLSLLALIGTSCGYNSNNNDHLMTAKPSEPVNNPTPSPIPVVNDIGHVPSQIELLQYPLVSVLIPLNASNLSSSAFGVNPLVIPKGTIVRWINNDTFIHSIISVDGYWSSSNIFPGQIFNFLFLSEGTYGYGSQPTDNITGTISVSK